MKEQNIEIAKMLGWIYIPESKCSHQYADGCHMEWGVNDVWVKNPTQKYLDNPCHYGTELYYGWDTKNSELFEEYTYELNFDKDWNLLMKAVEFIEAQPEVVVDCQKDFLNNCFFSGVLCKNVNAHFYYHTAQTRMEAIFETVYEYAKEHNQRKNTAAINIAVIK